MPYQVMVVQLESRGIKTPRVRPAVDDHAIHAREMAAWLKAESTMKLPEIVQVLGERHLEYHRELLQLQAQVVQGGPQLPVPGGYMQAAGTSPPAQQPLNTSSSPARLMGEGEELASEMMV